MTKTSFLTRNSSFAVENQLILSIHSLNRFEGADSSSGWDNAHDGDEDSRYDFEISESPRRRRNRKHRSSRRQKKNRISVEDRMKEILKSQELERKNKGFDDSDSDDGEDLEKLAQLYKKKPRDKEPKKPSKKKKEVPKEDESENSLDISDSDFQVKASELSKISERDDEDNISKIDENDPFSMFDAPSKRRGGLQDTNESGVVVFGSVEITKSDDDFEDDDFEDDEEEEEEEDENVIVHDEEHEPHDKPKPSMPSPRRENVSSDINFDDFEDAMEPSKIMDDVDLDILSSPSKLTTNDAVNRALDVARQAQNHASKLVQRADQDIMDLIAVKKSAVKSQETSSSSSSQIKQEVHLKQKKCLRTSDCRCEQCTLSLQGKNFFAEMEQLRTLINLISRRHPNNNHFSIGDMERLRDALRCALEAGMPEDSEVGSTATNLLEIVTRDVVSRKVVVVAAKKKKKNSECTREKGCKCSNCQNALRESMEFASSRPVITQAIRTDDEEDEEEEKNKKDVPTTTIESSSIPTTITNDSPDVTTNEVDLTTKKTTKQVPFHSSSSEKKKKNLEENVVLTKSQNMRLAATHAIMLDQTDSETEEQEKNLFWKFIDESVAIDERTKEEVREIRTPSPVKVEDSSSKRKKSSFSSFRGLKTSSLSSDKDKILELTKQLSEQEILISGFQKENERLISELKHSKKMIKVLREQLNGNSLHPITRDDQGKESDSANKKIVAQNLRRQLDLESQIEAMRQKLVQEKRDNIRSKRELQEKIQREVALRKHMEVHYKGIEVERVRKDSAELNRLREAVRMERERHRLKVSVLEEKLQWHVENAEMVGRNADLIRKQRDEIASLKEELSQEESTKIRVRQLEKKLRLAKFGAKSSPHVPGSIESLVAAVGYVFFFLLFCLLIRLLTHFLTNSPTHSQTIRGGTTNSKQTKRGSREIENRIEESKGGVRYQVTLTSSGARTGCV